MPASGESESSGSGPGAAPRAAPPQRRESPPSDGAGMDVTVADEQSTPVNLDEVDSLARFVLGIQGLPAGTELGIHLVDEVTIAAYNKRFRDRDEPTDVLSLPVDEIPAGRKDAPAPSEPDEPPLLLGDVVVCPAVAWQRAPERTGELRSEVLLLVTHGILHLLSYDHEDEPQAAEMEALEDDLLARWSRRQA